MESPTIGKLSSMYLLRLEDGAEDDVLPALAPGHPDPQTTMAHDAAPRGVGDAAAPATRSATDSPDEEALACSLENPESCEACQ